MAPDYFGFAAVNLGSDNPSSLGHVINRIEVLLGRKAVIDRQPANHADISVTWANIERARNLLGWEPRSTLDDGLLDCVQWYRDNHKLAKSIKLD